MSLNRRETSDALEIALVNAFGTGINPVSSASWNHASDHFLKELQMIPDRQELQRAMHF